AASIPGRWKADARSKIQQALFVDVADAGAVPAIGEMAFLAGVGEERRAEDGNALPARVAQAVIGDAARPFGAEPAGESLGRAVMVGIIDLREGVALPTNVVQPAVEIGEDHAHLDLHGPLVGGAQEAF